MNDQNNIRLLVVNDQESYCKHIKEQSDLGSGERCFECKCVPTGKAAMQTIAEWNPNLVLLDMFLSDMNSFDVLSYCKGTDTPVVATSETHLTQLADAVIEKGAIDYFEADDDPNTIEYLLDKIATIADTAKVNYWC